MGIENLSNSVHMLFHSDCTVHIADVGITRFVCQYLNYYKFHLVGPVTFHSCIASLLHFFDIVEYFQITANSSNVG